MTRPGLTFNDRYRLDMRIAAGGVGQVWQATDLLLERPVAVKVLRPEYSDHPETLERFRKEAKNAGALSNPHVAQVYDYGPAGPGGSPYLVMEFVDGPSLADLLAVDPLEPARALDIVAQAADGLSAAHRAGLVHRDVKPGNILISKTGLVKVTDFGIAYAVGQAPITGPGLVMGTTQYMAPERIAGDPGSAASDVYALGIVLHECLTGVPPHDGAPADVMAAHLYQPLPPLPDGMPPELADLIGRITVKNPALRVSDASELSALAAGLRDALSADLSAPAAAQSGTGAALPGAVMPGTALSGTALPGTALPGTGLPGTAQPASALPASALPGTALPGTALPGTGLPGTGLPGTGLPGTGLPGTGLPASALPGAVLAGSPAVVPGLRSTGYGGEYLGSADGVTDETLALPSGGAGPGSGYVSDEWAVPPRMSLPAGIPGQPPPGGQPEDRRRWRAGALAVSVGVLATAAMAVLLVSGAFSGTSDANQGPPAGSPATASSTAARAPSHPASASREPGTAGVSPAVTTPQSAPSTRRPPATPTRSASRPAATPAASTPGTPGTASSGTPGTSQPAASTPPASSSATPSPTPTTCFLGICV